MRYGSVCSGIEAASQAWEPLGWSPQFFSEIDPFPCAVLAHHYGSNLPDKPVGNGVPNHGDMTKFQEWPDHAIDLLVGGTPCQSFSVAGLRAGLADPRGNLMLTYLAVAAKYRPRWLVWENVPGVLSSGEGRDFGSFLTGLAELGYGFAYRVLDAQYVRVGGFGRAVPQRRRRVFVVGYLGDWRRAAAVLFDGPSLRGDPAPSRETGKNSAGTIDASLGRRRGSGMNPDQLAGVPAVSVTLTARDRDRKGPLPEADLSTVIVSHALRADGFDASEDGTGRGTPLVPVAPTLNAGGNATGGDRQYGMSVDTAEALVPVVAASLTRGAESAGKGGYAGRRQEDDVNILAIPFDTTQITSHANRSQPKAGDPMHPIPAHGHAPAIALPIPIDMRQASRGATMTNNRAEGSSGGAPGTGIGEEGDPAPTLTSSHVPALQHGWAVRRLTPVEGARLQGFPDDYLSQVKYRGKAPADGPMYKALGNSMAVNVMRWIGERIEMVDAL